LDFDDSIANFTEPPTLTLNLLDSSDSLDSSFSTKSLEFIEDALQTLAEDDQISGRVPQEEDENTENKINSRTTFISVPPSAKLEVLTTSAKNSTNPAVDTSSEGFTSPGPVDRSIEAAEIEAVEIDNLKIDNSEIQIVKNSVEVETSIDSTTQILSTSKTLTNKNPEIQAQNLQNEADFTSDFTNPTENPLDFIEFTTEQVQFEKTSAQNSPKPDFITPPPNSSLEITNQLLETRGVRFPEETTNSPFFPDTTTPDFDDFEDSTGQEDFKLFTPSSIVTDEFFTDTNQKTHSKFVTEPVLQTTGNSVFEEPEVLETTGISEMDVINGGMMNADILETTEIAGIMTTAGPDVAGETTLEDEQVLVTESDQSSENVKISENSENDEILADLTPEIDTNPTTNVTTVEDPNFSLSTTEILTTTTGTTTPTSVTNTTEFADINPQNTTLQNTVPQNTEFQNTTNQTLTISPKLVETTNTEIVPSNEPGSNVGLIVGASVGGFVGLILLGLLIVFIVKKIRNRKSFQGEYKPEIVEKEHGIGYKADTLVNVIQPPPPERLI